MEKKRKPDALKIAIYVIIFLFGMLAVCHVENSSVTYKEAYKAAHPNEDVPVLDMITVVSDELTYKLTEDTFGIVFTVNTFKWCVVYAAVVLFVLYYIKSTQKKTYTGKEKGSAEWASYKDDNKFADKDKTKNMILTDTVQMSMNTRLHRKNNNIFIVGGSGSGKSRFFAKPNLMQANCSFVVTDPKGELLDSTAGMFEREGYVVKVFNLVEMEYSCCYNPFHYIRKKGEVFVLINQLIKNTTPSKASSGDAFWEKAETALLEALFLFLLEPISKSDFVEFASDDDCLASIGLTDIGADEFLDYMKDVVNFLENVKFKKHLSGVMELLEMANVKEEDENYISDLDLIFKVVKWKSDKQGTRNVALEHYNLFKMAAGKTAKSILISVGVRLQCFLLPEMQKLTMTDTLELDKMGDRKTVLFVVIPDNDKSYNFIVAMMYNQLFQKLYYIADFGNNSVMEDKLCIPRSLDSFDFKKKKLFAMYDKLESTDGAKAVNKLLKELKELEKELNTEFGVSVSSFEFIKSAEQTDHKTMLQVRKSFEERTKELEDALSDRIGYLKYTLDGKNVHGEHFLKKLYGINNPDKNAVHRIIKYLEWGELNKVEYGTAERLKQLEELLLETQKEYYEKSEEFNGYSRSQKGQSRYEEVKGERDSLYQDIEDIIFIIATEYGVAFPTKLNKALNLNGKSGEANKELWDNYISKVEEVAYDLTGIVANSGRLKVPVRFILDEFPNIGEIPDFQILIATMRSREISVSIIVQALSQMKETYKDNWGTIVGNCDSLLFLGGTEQETLEYISKRLGNATIDVKSTSRSQGKSGSSSQSWQKDSRELKRAEEVGLLKDNECILLIRGSKPYLSRKYRIEKHKRYKCLAENNKAYIYPYREKFNVYEQAKRMEKQVQQELIEIKASEHKNAEKTREMFRQSAMQEAIDMLSVLSSQENNNKERTDNIIKEFVKMVSRKVRKQETISSAKEDLKQYLSEELKRNYNIEVSLLKDEVQIVEGIHSVNTTSEKLEYFEEEIQNVENFENEMDCDENTTVEMPEYIENGENEEGGFSFLSDSEI